MVTTCDKVYIVANVQLRDIFEDIAFKFQIK